MSELCLGTMTFGNESDEQIAGAIMARAVDASVNFFDAANIYNEGRTEEIVAYAQQRNVSPAALAVAW